MTELLPHLGSRRLGLAWTGDVQKVVMTYDRVLTLGNNSHRVNKIPEVFTKTQFVSPRHESKAILGSRSHTVSYKLLLLQCHEQAGTG